MRIRSLMRGLVTVVTAATSLSSQSPPRRPTPLGLDEYLPAPKSNPLTAPKIALGRKLFFDAQLSIDRSVACASCHRPAYAFSDTVGVSRGALGQRTQRNTPSILNRGYGERFFWDGRADDLETTVVQPIENPREMGLPLPSLVARLRRSREYRRLFAEVFHDSITATTIARGLASYVRSLRSGDSPADRFLQGDRSALSPDAVHGRELFLGKAGCVTCHNGPTFTDERVHNTGASMQSPTGRAELDRGTQTDGFKVPSLRNVALTAPYMHDGSLATLDAVVEFYNRGGGPNSRLDPEIHPLGLSGDEQHAVVAFLRSLTSRQLPNPRQPLSGPVRTMKQIGPASKDSPEKDLLANPIHHRIR